MPQNPQALSQLGIGDILGAAHDQFVAAVKAPAGSSQQNNALLGATALAGQASLQVVAEQQDVAAQQARNNQELVQAAAASNADIASAVTALYNGAHDSIAFGQAMASKKADEANRAQAAMEEAQANTPSFFSNPIAWIAGKYKAGKFQDQAAEAASEAKSYLANTSLLVDTARVQMQDAISIRTLTANAAQTQLGAQLSANVLENNITATRDAAMAGQLGQVVSDYGAQAMKVAEFAQRQAELSFRIKQAKSEDELRKLQTERARMEIEAAKNAKSAEEQAMNALLVGKPRTPANLNQARTQVATLQKEDPGAYSALVTAGAVGINQPDQQHFDSAVVQGMTIGQIRSYGTQAGNAALARLGDNYTSQLATQYEKALSEQAAAAAGQTYAMWSQMATPSTRNSLRTQAGKMAAEVVSTMRPQELLNTLAGIARINTGGIPEAAFASPNTIKTSYGFDVGSKEALALNNPAFRVAFGRAQAEGGVTRGTLEGAKAMIDSLVAAGVKDPYAAAAKVYAAHGSLATKTSLDAQILDTYGVQRPPAALLQLEQTGQVVDLADPVQLRTLLLQDRAKLQSSYAGSASNAVGSAALWAIDVAGTVGEAAGKLDASQKAAREASLQQRDYILGAITAPPDVSNMYSEPAGLPQPNLPRTRPFTGPEYVQAVKQGAAEVGAAAGSAAKAAGKVVHKAGEFPDVGGMYPDVPASKPGSKPKNLFDMLVPPGK